jgi:RNA polymerase sigma-70 factor (ECF subfamily)
MTDLTFMINGCIKKDHRSETLFYNTYQTRVRYFVIKKMKTNEYVDEIISMTFERALNKIHLYSGTGSIVSWLFTIVRHVMFEVINKIDKRKLSGVSYKKPEHLNLIAEVNNIWSTDSSSELVVNDLLTKIKEILPKKEYIVFMAYFEGYNHREIAEKFNLTEGTSKWYLFQARNKIKEKISNGFLVV